MRSIKLGYIMQITAVVAFILVAGVYQLPKYSSRFPVIALLTVVDMVYWLSVKGYVSQRFKNKVTFAYWLPLSAFLLFLVAGLLSPFAQWTPFLRIYFPGMLMILMIGKGLFLSILIVGDVFIIPLNLIKGIDPQKEDKKGGWYRPRSFLLSSAAIATTVMLVFISGMFFWVTDYKLYTIEVSVKNLPEKFDGYKIIQISDLHLGSFATDGPLNKIIGIVNDQHPDVILFTGDLVNFTTDEAYPFEEVMKKFTAVDGIYSVLGNHDYGEYTKWNTPEDKVTNDKALFAFYDRIGWHLLRNQNAVIHRDSASIAIIGIENWSLNKRFGKKGNLNQALRGTGPAQYKILMSHDPTHWDAEVSRRFPQIGLTLSGHTHAFQIAVETGTIKWSPASLIYRQWGGLFEKVNAQGIKQYLYVNRGAGTLGYPGRIFSRPEVTLLILRRAG